MFNCKDCVFAEYYNGRQISCRLEKLKGNASNLTLSRDDSKVFYELKNHCFYKRDEKWNDKNNKPNKVKSIEYIKAESKLQYGVILYEYEDLDILETLESIDNFTIPPRYIDIYTCLNSKVKYDDIYHLVRNYRKWMIRENVDDESYNMYSACLNYIHGDKQPFTLLYHKTYDLSPNTIEEISGKILDENLQFQIAKTSDYEVVLMPTPILTYSLGQDFDLLRFLPQQENIWIAYSL